mmetsp:Transcript_32366/g.99764  ORF Transcript_32366/g.99764 Transcript_32366/m.99764 type:complete len:161 (+) Transcript_32366:270-752(+)
MTVSLDAGQEVEVALEESGISDPTHPWNRKMFRRRCSMCGWMASLNKTPLYICGLCFDHSQRFCSDECFRAAWDASHRDVCGTSAGDLAAGKKASVARDDFKKAVRRTCAQCGRRAGLTAPAFSCCDGCGGPRYCDHVCQRLHWLAGHREVCSWDDPGGA